MISDGTAAVVVLVDYYWSANVHTALMVQIRTRPKSIRSSSLKMFVEKKNKYVKAKECSEVDAKEFLNDALGRDGGDGKVLHGFVFHELSLILFWQFINAIAFHLGRYERISPSFH